MWIYNDQIIKSPKTMVIDGVTYPRQIFRDSEQLAALGITPYSETLPNQRYYWTGARTIVDGVGTYEAIPRDVDGLKENMVQSIKEAVGSRLQPTDWMVIRAADGGSAVPQETADYRAAVRAEGNTKEAEVNALVTLDDIIAYENAEYTEVRKVKHTDDEGVETYGPETEESVRTINKCTYFACDPVDDPAFVSLTENV